jgi:hypothetical protein
MSLSLAFCTRIGYAFKQVFEPPTLKEVFLRRVALHFEEAEGLRLNPEEHGGLVPEVGEPPAAS